MQKDILNYILEHKWNKRKAIVCIQTLWDFGYLSWRDFQYLKSVFESNLSWEQIKINFKMEV